MNCRKARSYISAYYDDELSYSTREELLKHIENCTNCQKEMLFQEQVRAGLKAFPREELSDDFNDRLLARIYSAPRTEETKISNVPSVLTFRLRSLAPVFAAAGFIIIAAFLAFSQFAIIGGGSDNIADKPGDGPINNVRYDRPQMTFTAPNQNVSASEMALNVARMESLQIVTSLKDNKLMIDRMRLDASNQFGGFQDRTSNLNESAEEKYRNSRKYIYPVIRNAGSDRNPY